MSSKGGAGSPAPSNSQCLLALYAIQQYQCIRGGASAGYIERNADTFLAGIQRENRSVSFRLYVHGVFNGCLGCGRLLPPDSEGDHLLARNNGGPEGAQNYLPLCGKCNSSKGACDFLEWWAGQGRSAAELSADVVCAYARVAWRWHSENGTLNDPADDIVRRAVRRLLSTLPSVEHQRAVHRAVVRESVAVPS